MYEYQEPGKGSSCYSVSFLFAGYVWSAWPVLLFLCFPRCILLQLSTVGRQSFLVVGLDVARSVFRLRRVGLLQVWAASGSPRCRRVVSDSSYFDCCGSTYGFCGHFDPSSSAALSVICGRSGCCCGSPSCYVLVCWWSPSSVCSRPPCCCLLPDPLSFAEAVFWSVGRLPRRQVPSSFMP